jgi:hypothetical protein
MAETDSKKAFPMLSPAHWWKLRKKFRQSIPGIVTDSYLATVLDMQANSARANVMPFLKSMGLIDSDNKPTNRVPLWRDDEEYPKVCKDILQEVYPEELIAAIEDPRRDRVKTERWFANQNGVGQEAARRMAAIYTVLVEADSTKESTTPTKATQPKAPTPRAEQTGKPTKAAKQRPKDKDELEEPLEDNKQAKQRHKVGPDVNINLQIHISADASPDQIEQIFLSMSKHLYKNG